MCVPPLLTKEARRAIVLGIRDNAEREVYDYLRLYYPDVLEDENSDPCEVGWDYLPDASFLYIRERFCTEATPDSGPTDSSASLPATAARPVEKNTLPFGYAGKTRPPVLCSASATAREASGLRPSARCLSLSYASTLQRLQSKAAARMKKVAKLQEEYPAEFIKFVLQYRRAVVKYSNDGYDVDVDLIDDDVIDSFTKHITQDLPSGSALHCRRKRACSSHKKYIAPPRNREQLPLLFDNADLLFICNVSLSLSLSKKYKKKITNQEKGC